MAVFKYRDSSGKWVNLLGGGVTVEGGGDIPITSTPAEDVKVWVDPTEDQTGEYYTKEEVNTLIDAVNTGDIDLTNYYTILQVDEKVEALQEHIDNIDDRLTFVEDVIETPISTEDLEGIIGLDMNKDGKIGK